MTTKSQEWMARASAVIPGGVNSPVRAFGAVGGQPVFIKKAHGARLWDEDGREYIDYVGSWGPMILGHADPAVVQAVQAAAAEGLSFGATTRGEVELAECVIERMPTIEMLRLVSSGTEATMTALRLARGYTGRTKVIKFAGCYHGHSDSFLVKAGSGAATLGVPNSAGVPAGVVSETLIAEYNDLASVERLITDYGTTIAAVIVEPVVGNAGVLVPEQGFLAGLRQLTEDAGILLIFDEVMTGFRVARGGAQALYGIRPDLTTLGKIIGGGLPIGAVGGRRNIMELLAPLGPVYQAGTLSGNPVAVAAGLATLKSLSEESYSKIEKASALLHAGISDNLRRLKLPYVYQRVCSMATLFFAEGPIRNFSDAIRCDTRVFARYFREMLAEGIYLPPSQFEAFFVSLAHDEAAIDKTIEAHWKALKKICNG